MQKVSFLSLAIPAFFLSSWACLGPANIQGVAFTSGETLDLSKLTAMGVEDVNYFKDGDEGLAGIRYKSHYDSRAMVFVGNYGMSYQENVKMACMGVILPLPESADVYAPIDTATFNFAAAVKAELVWLAYNNVVTISAGMIAKIDSTFRSIVAISVERTGVARNGSLQYWTHANSTLGYNSWYRYDSTTGKWSAQGEDGVNGVDGVLGVEGMKGLHGCSVVSPGVGIPPEGLGTTAAASKRPAVDRGMQPLTIRHTGNGGMIVFLPRPASMETDLTVMDCRGAVACRKRIAAGMKSLYIGGLARGQYHVRLMR